MVEPGTPPSLIASALGIEVAERRNLGPGVRGCRDPFISAIYVAPMHYGPRREWTIAHELAECEIRDALPDGDEHEAYCQRIAAEVMMPRGKFCASGESCGWDLATLRRWWQHCSWEALAQRVAEVAPTFAASSWEGARTKFRRGEITAEAADLEAFVAAEATASRAHSHVALGGLTARAWWTGGRRAVTLVGRP